MSTARPSFMSSYAARKAAIRGLAPSALIPQGERWRKNIKDVREGGYLRFDDKTFMVVDISTYAETDEKFRKTGSSWTELRLLCLETGETVWLEWEEDDDIEMYLTLRSLSFRDIRDDEGGSIDDDDLDDLADDQDSITLRGKTFDYDDDYGALYKRGGKGRDQKGDKVYFYDFVAADGECITVEEWLEGHDKYSYELFLSRPLDAASVEIVSTGTA